MEELFGAGLRALGPQQHVVALVLNHLQELISANIALHEQLLQRSKTADLMLVHAIANRMSYRAPEPLTPINESDFLSLLVTPLRRLINEGSLHGYQKRYFKRDDGSF